MQPGLIIVSNRLPVSVKKTDGKLEFFPSIGGLATGLASYAKNKKNKWIGWPGIASEDVTEAQKIEITEELEKHNCYPVFLTRRQLDSYYNGFSNSVLWPMFHELSANKSALADESYWRAYKRVNEEFAQVVLSLSSTGSTVWVHDYQLLMLPSYLRAERPHDKIGYFLHIPFPSPKTFNKVPHYKELLAGLIGSDLIGFHTTGYVDHFLAACQDLDLGIVGKKELLLPDRIIRVTDFPMGIDYAKYVRATKQKAVRRELAKLKVKYRGKKVIFSVDRIDPTKGLVERLQAYQLFLRQNKSLLRKVVMVMIAVPSRTDTEIYKKLKRRIDALVKEIEEEFGTSRWKPIDYITTPLTFTQLSPYFQLADVAFITPIIDGMNLVAKEYIASQSKKDGVLVLSETAGAAEELKDAILVDPTKSSSLVDGLLQALTLPQRELKQRVNNMQEHLSEFTVQDWAGSFMNTLKKPVVKHVTHALTVNRTRMMVESFRAAEHRLLLMDYDGVLAPFVNNPKDAIPTEKLLNTLAKLAEVPNTDIVIISGRSKTDLGEWFGHSPVSLTAEHGVFIRKAGTKRWTVARPVDNSWRDVVLPILQVYAEKTPGAFVETKTTAVVWHYRQAKPYYAQKHLVILKRLLVRYAKRYNLAIRQGHMILEIRSQDATKGSAAEFWMQQSDPSFILVLGDDYTDEDMFETVPAWAHTVKVGRGRTMANLRLNKQDDVIPVLEKLAK